MISYIVYRSPEAHKSRTFLWKAANFFFEISFTLEILIPIFYWGILYSKIPFDHEGDRFFATVCVHLITAMTLWIDMCFNMIPFYKRHLYLILAFGMCYNVINFVVTKVNGYPVYPGLGWDDV